MPRKRAPTKIITAGKNLLHTAGGAY